MLCRIKDAVSQSSALGNREYKDMNTEGRIFFDMHTYAVRELRLVQYSLNSLPTSCWEERKEDIYPVQITQLFNGSDETRRRLATYGLKNARLPLLVMQKLDCLMQDRPALQGCRRSVFTFVGPPPASEGDCVVTKEEPPNGILGALRREQGSKRAPTKALPFLTRTRGSTKILW